MAIPANPDIDEVEGVHVDVQTVGKHAHVGHEILFIRLKKKNCKRVAEGEPIRVLGAEHLDLVLRKAELIQLAATRAEYLVEGGIFNQNSGGIQFQALDGRFCRGLAGFIETPIL